MLLTKVPKIDSPTAQPGKAPPAAMNPEVVLERFAEPDAEPDDEREVGEQDDAIDRSHGSMQVARRQPAATRHRPGPLQAATLPGR